MVSLLNPENVIAGGEVACFIMPVLDDLRRTAAKITPIQTIIELSEIGEEAGVSGAIAYAFEQEPGSCHR
jgi:hypothetical protein